MRGLDATELLAVWEAGASADRTRRAALLLAVASSEDAPALGRLPIGERNRRLLALRAASFGPELETRAACPACAAELEARVAIADLLAGQQTPPSRLALPAGEGAIAVRLPGADDLAAVAGLAPLPAAQALLARCRLDAEDTDAASPELAEAFAALVAEADPLAEIELDLRCQDCGHAFARCLEVVAFLWREVEMQALRLLTEVHTLARAYGWSEREILGLSARRRAHYLQWVAG